MDLNPKIWNKLPKELINIIIDFISADYTYREFCNCINAMSWISQFYPYNDEWAYYSCDCGIESILFQKPSNFNSFYGYLLSSSITHCGIPKKYDWSYFIVDMIVYDINDKKIYNIINRVHFSEIDNYPYFHNYKNMIFPTIIISKKIINLSNNKLGEELINNEINDEYTINYLQKYNSNNNINIDFIKKWCKKYRIY